MAVNSDDIVPSLTRGVAARAGHPARVADGVSEKSVARFFRATQLSDYIGQLAAKPSPSPPLGDIRHPALPFRYTQGSGTPLVIEGTMYVCVCGVCMCAWCVYVERG